MPAPQPRRNYAVISDGDDAALVEIRYLADAKAHAWRSVRQRKATRADVWLLDGAHRRIALVHRVWRETWGKREMVRRGLPIEE